MKRTILFFSFVLLLLSSLLAQTFSWIDKSSNIPTAVSNASLTDVAAIGESVWISSSNLKGVFISNDGGNTFAFKELGVGIQGLFRFADGLRGWCAGGAYGFKTLDGGESWTPVFIGSTLLSITFANDQVGYVTGLGSVYRTDDSGSTWVKKAVIANLYTRDVMDASFPDPVNPFVGNVCVANETPTIFKTTDGGDTWTAVTLSGVTSSMNDLEQSDPSNGWAVGGGGNIFNYGNNSWNLVSAPLASTLNAVTSAPGAGDSGAVGNAGTILHYTSSSGWFQEASGLTNEYLAGVVAVNISNVYAVGMNKTFLKYAVANEVIKQAARVITLYPDPASTSVMIGLPGNLPPADLLLSLADISGKELIYKEYAPGLSLIELDISHVKSGITPPGYAQEHVPLSIN